MRDPLHRTDERQDAFPLPGLILFFGLYPMAALAVGLLFGAGFNVVEGDTAQALRHLFQSGVVTLLIGAGFAAVYFLCPRPTE